MFIDCISVFFFSSRRRHTRCALVTGVQTCALPIYFTNWSGHGRSPCLDYIRHIAGFIKHRMSRTIHRTGRRTIARTPQFLLPLPARDRAGRPLPSMFCFLVWSACRSSATVSPVALQAVPLPFSFFLSGTCFLFLLLPFP